MKIYQKTLTVELMTGIEIEIITRWKRLDEKDIMPHHQARLDEEAKQQCIDSKDIDEMYESGATDTLHLRGEYNEYYGMWVEDIDDFPEGMQPPKENSDDHNSIRH